MRKVILTGSDGFIGKSFKKTLSKTWDIVEVEKHKCWRYLLTFKVNKKLQQLCFSTSTISHVLLRVFLNDLPIKPSDPVKITFLILL